MSTDDAIDRTLGPSLEWITLVLIILTYLGLGLLLWYAARLPWFVLLPTGATLVAFHGSLQHEALHGHPTRSPLINEILVCVGPSLWVPYRRYKKLHLQHHNDMNLTNPERDPESYYLLPDHWAHLPAPLKQLYTVNNSLAGRMLLGPIITVIRFCCEEFRKAWQGDREIVQAWALHLPTCAMVIGYAVFFCGLPFYSYVLLFVWPGIGLSSVRSFCEHQAARDVGERTILVEAGWYFSLLFLNNNLHVAHHKLPRLAWYLIPRYYRSNRADLIAENRGYVMSGYGEIFRRYFLRPKEPVPYPDLRFLQH